MCKEGESLERWDNGGDYCPENCAWIPVGEQARNKEHCLWVLLFGVYRRFIEVCEEKGVNPSTAADRWCAGYQVEEIFHTGRLSPRTRLDKRARNAKGKIVVPREERDERIMTQAELRKKHPEVLKKDAEQRRKAHAGKKSRARKGAAGRNQQVSERTA
jgi:hypothetical protein